MRFFVPCTNCSCWWKSKPGITPVEAAKALRADGWSGKSGYLLCKRCKVKNLKGGDGES